MQKRRLTGFTVIKMLVTLVFVVLIGGIVFSYENRSEYCQTCGKRREGKSLSIFRQPLRWSHVEKPSEFSKLYTKFVSPNCNHKWRRTSYGWVNLLGGGVGCDTRYRRIFMEEQGLKQIRYLKDLNKIKTIVANCNVPNSSWPGEGVPNARGKNAFDAFDDLKQVYTPGQENQWWRKNRHLFVKK
jgi:hypothetical protein